MIREGSVEVVFCDPRDPSTLRARPWVRSDPDPLTALTQEEGRAKLAGYRRVRIEATEQPYAAEWEYTYAGSGGRLHGIERVFVGFGRAYIVQWRTPERTWQANLPRLGVITDSFRPPPRPPTGAV
jgi:hypothetical protein